MAEKEWIYSVYDVKRIVVTSCFMRPNNNQNIVEGNQTINIDFIDILFGCEFEKYFSCNRIKITGDREDGIIRRADLFGKLEYGVSIDSWASIYNDVNFGKYALERIGVIDQNSLVIGFELPPYILENLIKYKIPYIDFCIHPIRFMKDYIFGLRSNIKSVIKNIIEKKLSYSDDEIFDFARTYRAASKRVARGLERRIKEGSALFVGQTSIDASLIGNDGRLISKDDISDYIYYLIQKYGFVYYKRHPHTNLEDEKRFASKFGRNKVELIEAHVYNLLSMTPISLVSAASSSVITEAYFFNKKSLRMLDNHINNYGIFDFEKNKNSVYFYHPMKPILYHKNFAKFIFEDTHPNYYDFSREFLPLKDMLGFKWAK